MKTYILLAIAMSSSVSVAATITFNGQAQMENLTAIPWVLGSTMWGGVQTTNGTGTAFGGFSSLNGLNASLLTFTAGDLELTSYLSPTASSAGYEIYTESDSFVTPLYLRYNGSILASGTMNSLRADVDNVNDGTAIVTGYGQFTAAGADPSFYNELMALTQNTGWVRFDTATFTPVNGAGLFNTVTVLSSVPEPSKMGLLLLGCSTVVSRRRRI